MSKKVYLRRKEINNHLPKEVLAEAVTKLSSVFVNRQPLKGFSPSDEKKYLNGILDVSPEHVDWPKHTKEFWANLTIPVGFTGVELKMNEIGGRFYIQDTSRDELKRFNEIQFKKDADKEYIKVSSDLKNMKRILRLLGEHINPDTLSHEQVENALYDLKTANPKQFLKVAQDKNLESKAEIDEMIEAGVLRKIGNQVIFIDEILGDTVDDTVIYLKNKKNSGKLTTLRAKLKEVAV